MLRLILACTLWTLVCLAIASVYLFCLSDRTPPDRDRGAPQPIAGGRPLAARDAPPLISMAGEKLLFEWDAEGEPKLSVPRDTLAAVAGAVRLVPIVIVENDGETARLKRWWEAEKLQEYIPTHRLLVCSSVESRATMIRQLTPQLHLEWRADCLAKMHGTIPAVLRDSAEEAWNILQGVGVL